VQGPTFPGYQYRVQVKRSTDINWTSVNNSFTVFDETGTIPTNQVATGDYFAYLPDTANADNVLAIWETGGNDLWNVKIDILGVTGSDVHQLQLHSSGLSASIDIDILAGDCGKFPVGTLLSGFFVARDDAGGSDYLAHYGLGTSPFGAPAGALSPTVGFVPTALPPGNDWSLDTSAMAPCGYTITVTAVSRTIYNSSPSYTDLSGSAGFCLQIED
jgi:hypothetical protein